MSHHRYNLRREIEYVVAVPVLQKTASAADLATFERKKVKILTILHCSDKNKRSGY
jgi:hypothetical protein